MAFQEVKAELTGIAELVLHNGWMANPLSPLSKMMKGLTAKKNKTDGDYEIIANLEWLSGWYYKGDVIDVAMQGSDILIGDCGDLVIPTKVIFATFWGGAKQHKLGMKFKQGVFVIHDAELLFPQKRALDEMMADPNLRIGTMEKVNAAKVLRTRPKLLEWTIRLSFNFDDSVLDQRQIEMCMASAGSYVGIGERRPSWGRYAVKILSVKPVVIG